MAFWKRARPQTCDPETVLGELACSFGGCGQHTGMACAYVDRRGRACGTAWCPEHRMIAGQAIYCRRHWGTVIGLEDAGGPLPDVENRAPSLVAWVGRRLEPSIKAILAERTDKDGSLAMVSVPVHLVFLGLERARAWERTWAVADHTGHRHAITLQVAEQSSTELSVLVGRRVVARMVPPWILARQAGVQTSPETDRAHRADFYESLRNVIAASVARDEALA